MLCYIKTSLKITTNKYLFYIHVFTRYKFNDINPDEQQMMHHKNTLVLLTDCSLF